MVYFACFCIMLIMLLYIMAFEKTVNINVLLLVIVLAIGNGGYYALAYSSNLEEAILANIMSYSVASYAPLVLLFVICNICQINIRKRVSVILYTIQILIFLSVCTIGKLDIFYKTVEFHAGTNGNSYLTKTYGPMHTLCIASMIIYAFASVVVEIYSLNRRNVVSRAHVDIVLFLDILTIGVYLLERIIHFNFELIPIFETFAGVVIINILLRISTFSVYNNQEMFMDELKKKGYIIFDKNFKYMGSNEYATILFPELKDWEIEKKIPGNGGRFNTFLRQPLLNYAKDGEMEETSSRTYEYKGESYCYEIGTLMRNGKRSKGYFIRVSNVTEVLRDKK